MFMEFLLRDFERVIRAAASRCGTHNISDAHVGRLTVLGSHMVTDVALGHDADEIEILFILNHRCAPAA
jgi:hypothetical protein